jgi:hypothetical protein
MPRSGLPDRGGGGDEESMGAAVEWRRVGSGRHGSRRVGRGQGGVAMPAANALVGPAKESGPNATLFDAVDWVVVPVWPNIRLAGPVNLKLILPPTQLYQYSPRENWADSDNGTYT